MVIKHLSAVLMPLLMGEGVSLELVYDAQTDIPAAFAALYSEKDGKWHLTGVNGLRTNDDVAALQTALQKERGAHKDTKAKFAGLAGKDIDEVLSMLDEVEALREQVKANGNVDEIVASRVKQATAPLERKLTEAAAREAEFTAQIGTFKQREHSRTVGDAVMSAATKLKALPEAIGDLVMLASSVFEITEDGKVIAKDGVSGVTAGIAPEVWLSELKRSKPYFWPASQGSGGRGGQGGGGGVDNPWTAAGWNMTKQGQVYKEDRALAEQYAKAAGVPVLGGVKPTK